MDGKTCRQTWLEFCLAHHPPSGRWSSQYAFSHISQRNSRPPDAAVLRPHVAHEWCGQPLGRKVQSCMMIRTLSISTQLQSSSAGARQHKRVETLWSPTFFPCCFAIIYPCHSSLPRTPIGFVRNIGPQPQTSSSTLLATHHLRRPTTSWSSMPRQLGWMDTGQKSQHSRSPPSQQICGRKR